MTVDSVSAASRRARAAHERAARTHDHAVCLHGDAAELFDRHGKPDLAARERAAASREAAAAQAERDHAVSLWAEVPATPIPDPNCP